MSASFSSTHPKHPPKPNHSVGICIAISLHFRSLFSIFSFFFFTFFFIWLGFILHATGLICFFFFLWFPKMKILNANAKLLVFNEEFNAINFLLCISFYHFMHLHASPIFSVTFSYSFYSRDLPISFVTISSTQELLRSTGTPHFIGLPFIVLQQTLRFFCKMKVATLCWASLSISLVQQHLLTWRLWVTFW